MVSALLIHCLLCSTDKLLLRKRCNLGGKSCDVMRTIILICLTSININVGIIYLILLY